MRSIGGALCSWLVLVIALGGRPAEAADLTGMVEVDGQPASGVEVEAFADSNSPLSDTGCLFQIFDVLIDGCSCEPARSSLQKRLNQRPPPSLAHVTSDSQGRFTLRGDLPPRVALVAHRLHSDLWAEIDELATVGTPSGQTPLVLPLRAEAPIKVRLEEAGAMLLGSGSRVVVINNHTRQRYPAQVETGSATVGPLPPGRYSVFALREHATAVLTMDEAGHVRDIQSAFGGMFLEPDRTLSLEGGSLRLEAVVKGASGPVEVRIEGPGCSWTTHTSAQQRVAFTQLPKGEFTVWAHDRQRGQGALVKVPASASAQATLELTHQGVRGTVLRDGTPLAGVSVSAPSIPMLADVTGPDGRFDLTPLAPGPQKLSFFEAGSVPLNSHEVLVADGGTEIEVSLIPAVHLSGWVHDPDGGIPHPVGLELVARVDAGPPPTRFIDKDGRFEFTGVAPGAYTLEAKGMGIEPIAIPVTAPAEGVGLVVARLPSLRGTLTLGGKPVAGAQIDSHRVTGPDGGWLGNGRAQHSSLVTTGNDGSFELPLPEAGWISVHAIAHEPDSADGDTEVGIFVDPAVNAAPVALVLDPGRDVTGVVVDPEGRPVNGAQVWLGSPLRPSTTDRRSQLRYAGLPTITALTDEAGRFRFARVHRTYPLHVAAGGGLVLDGPEVKVTPGGGELTVKLTRYAQLKGIVLRPEHQPPSQMTINGQLFDDGTGRFTLPIRASGPMLVEVMAEGAMPMHFHPEVLVGHDLTLAPITLHPRRVIKGQLVQTHTHSPLMSYQVATETVADDPVAENPAWTDKEGHFELSTGRAGAQVPMVILDPQRVEVLRVRVNPDEPVTIEVDGPGSLALTVRNRHGKAAPLRKVDVVSDDEPRHPVECQGSGRAAVLWTNAFGTATCQPLRPGRYRLLVHDPQGDRDAAFEVRTGESVAVEVDLGP